MERLRPIAMLCRLAAIATADTLILNVAGTAIAASPAKLTLVIADTTAGATTATGNSEQCQSHRGSLPARGTASRVGPFHSVREGMAIGERSSADTRRVKVRIL